MYITHNFQVLLFNKVDILPELLENAPMRHYFENYNGKTFDEACKYLEYEFLKLPGAKTRSIITQFVSAFDGKAMESMYFSQLQ